MKRETPNSLTLQQLTVLFLFEVTTGPKMCLKNNDGLTELPEMTVISSNHGMHFIMQVTSKITSVLHIQALFLPVIIYERLLDHDEGRAKSFLCSDSFRMQSRSHHNSGKSM